MLKAPVDKDARGRATTLHCRLAALAALLVGAQVAYAQVDTVSTAVQGHVCAQDQFASLHGGTLGCTAKDLTATVTAMVAGTSVGNCPSGGQGTVDVIVTLQSGSPDRYDVGLFIGENGNSAIAAGGTCSVNIFPTTSAPNPGWVDAGDHNQCGDYLGNSTTVNEIDGVLVKCVGDVNGNLVVPFAVVYGNNDNNAPATCSVDTVTADSSPKCIHNDSAVIPNVFVTNDANPVCNTGLLQDGIVYDPVANTITLTVTVTNDDPLHPQAADGTTFSDDFSVATPAVTVNTFSCTPTGGAACTIQNVAGVVSGTITSFPFGSSVDLSVTLAVPPNPGNVPFSSGLSLTTPPTVLPPSPPYTFDPLTGISTNATACLSAVQLPVKLQSFDVH